ncbi:MAG: hypothetical protein KJ620_09695 [Candidatus Edwardsbacteria bacterium]|nr:hypothetical protein [Candidatus Edwardsbacteria bacterium]MBU1577682.1 hypothetical protein [Candidatus Edwardsbacteria bacterium]MBU2594579.1 hypothetical protein [Candidatus Edwardsbacteria bacterium]
MRNTIIFVIIATIFYSCGKIEENNNTKVDIKRNTQTIQDSTIYCALKYNLENFTMAHSTSNNIDSVIKYYELNENNKIESKAKSFPETQEDEHLLNTFIGIIMKGKLNVTYIIKMTLINKNNAELGEVFIDVLAKYWQNPEKDFIKAVISLPDSECARIIYSTIPEEPKEVKEIIKKVDKLPEIKNLKGYDLLKKILIELANR